MTVSPVSVRWIVTGSARCGTSLVLQMIDALGFGVTGAYPSFEDAAGLCPEMPGLSGYRDRFVKILDIDRAVTRVSPSIDLQVVWIRRRSRLEQAKSYLKTISVLQPDLRLRTAGIDRLERALVISDAKIDATLRANCPHALRLVFEDVLADPYDAAGKIAGWLEERAGHPPEAKRLRAAIDTVRKRDPNCYAGMLEAQLLRERAERRP